MERLRFKDHNSNYEEPDSLIIADLFDKIKDINKNKLNKNVITNSAEFGLISQKLFFDKDIAIEENTAKYTIIKKGDFVYNPRKSSTAPYGPFNCYRLEEPGIVSPLYSCLRPKNPEYTDYLLYYFESPAWHSYIYHNGNQGGARHDRVGMTEDLLMGIPVSLPIKEERDKIVSFLKLLDDYLKNQEEIVKCLVNRKEGILTKLFNGELCFKNVNYHAWEEIELSEILKERKEKSNGTEDIYSVSVSKGLVNQVEHLGRSFAAEDTSKYKVAHYGDVIYTKSPTGSFKWGIVKQSRIEKNVIISPLYGVFSPLNANLGYIIDAYFSSSIRAHNYLITQIRKGAKNTINISNDEFLAKSIYLPIDEEEQRVIANFISIMNEEIDVARKKLESIRNVKKGILQKLFIY
ncbi:MAG: restriction endonuclease subunit S [Acholeplasmatales bacterium]|nr:restriction endonuclease subunit S [Acholeplasmatales bacterium]